MGLAALNGNIGLVVVKPAPPLEPGQTSVTLSSGAKAAVQRLTSPFINQNVELNR